MSEITALLGRAGAGDARAANELLPIIYARLKELARRQIAREPDSPSLGTTALVHDVYLALFGDVALAWQDRAHFFAYAARAMRNLMVDRARSRLCAKRGAGAAHVELDAVEVAGVDAAECFDVVALDQALTAMSRTHPRWVQVVELRFFSGLSVEEVAAGLGIDARTVERDWHKARAFIHAALAPP